MVREKEFRNWLSARGYVESSAENEISRVRRLEAAMLDYELPDTDIDAAFTRDQLGALLAAIQQSIHDLPEKIPPIALVPRSAFRKL